MRLSQYHVPTLKESPKEAEVISHQLLLRAGYIRKVAAGIYNFLPLGWRSVRRVEEIVREEMERAGALEIRLPAVQPAELWKESERWEKYGSELLRFKDRKGGPFCLGPTHEEVVTALVRGEVRSYRQMPLNLFQIQTKFRDELRPRAGLMRGREFIMKDAYSFDVSEEAAHVTYRRMYDAYVRIFDRCGLAYRPVEADTGAIGGNLSHEFQVLAESGEDAIVSCPSCGYTANVEKAELGEQAEAFGADGPLEEVATPGVGSIDDVAALLGAPHAHLVKTLVCHGAEGPALFLLRGNRELNEVKAAALLGVDELRMANAAEVEATVGVGPGFAGPVGPRDVPVYADRELAGLVGGICGANRVDMHLRGLSLERDLPHAKLVDVGLARGGDACGRCGGTFEAFRGIEVGQVFYLGTRYSAPMGANFLGEDGSDAPIHMGCYGIGVTRILAAAIEQHHDADGIRWPMALAPFQVIVLPLQLKDDAVVALADSIYGALQEAGVDVLLDDRDLRPGNKFKDADLIGIPLRVTIGSRSAEKGMVELRDRRGGENEEVPAAELVAEVRRRIAEQLAEQGGTSGGASGGASESATGGASGGASGGAQSGEKG